MVGVFGLYFCTLRGKQSRANPVWNVIPPPSSPPPFCSTIQGTLPKSRHFLFVDDAVDALLLVLEKGTAGEIYNVGSSCEIPITQLARELVKMVGLWGNWSPN